MALDRGSVGERTPPQAIRVNSSLRDGSIRYQVLEPKDAELKRAGVCLEHRNGQVEAAYADIQGLRAVYHIGAE